MVGIKERRERLGLSQRGLAKKAGVAYKTLQMIESGHQDPRWSTLLKIDKALGADPLRLKGLIERHFGCKADTAAELGDRIAEDGEKSWRGWLPEFVDTFRRRPESAAIREAPSHAASPRARALIASTVELLCDEADLPVPEWCRAVPALHPPWFPSESEALKASALVESPPQFRRRNIFVLGNFLNRA